MTDDVKHNIKKIYEPKKTTGEKRVFIQVIGTMGEDKCMLSFSKKKLMRFIGRIGWTQWAGFVSRPNSLVSDFSNNSSIQHIDSVNSNFWARFRKALIRCKYQYKNCTVYNARTTIQRPLAQLRQQILQNKLLLQHSDILAMWRTSNIIFCDICCFTCASRLYNAL